MPIALRLLKTYSDGDLLLGWDPVPGAAGYQITHSLTTKKPHTWDALTQRDRNFPACNARVVGGAEWYRVTELELGETGEYRPAGQTGPTGPGPSGPGPSGPTGDEGLIFAPPALSNPDARTLMNAARSVPKDSGRDLRLTLGEVLTGNIGQIEAYGDHVIIGGKITGGSSNSSGHVIPRENTGVAHYEGMEIVLTVPGDAFTQRWRQPTMQVGGCLVEVTDAGTSFHSDGFQSQEAIIDLLMFDLCTFVTDYQGIFQSNEAQNQGPGRSRMDRTIISRCNFRPGKHGYPATWWFKAFPPRPNADPVGLTEIYESWIPDSNPLAHLYPNGHTWVTWDGQPNKYGCFLETRRHPVLNRDFKFVRFSTSADKVPAGKPLAGQTCGDCGVRGDGGFWVYPLAEGCPFGDFYKRHVIGRYRSNPITAEAAPRELAAFTPAVGQVKKPEPYGNVIPPRYL